MIHRPPSRKARAGGLFFGDISLIFLREESSLGDDPIQLLHNQFYITHSFLLVFMYVITMCIMEA